MKIELMIYVYIAICVSMILYNIVYVFILRHREKALAFNSDSAEKIITEQLERIKEGKPVTEKHKKSLCKKLNKTRGITAFDKALENVFEKDSVTSELYILEIFPVFEYLTRRYIQKDTIKIAYFPYILYKYNVLSHDDSDRLVSILLELLRSLNVYCRENALKAVYSMQRPDVAISALKIIDKNLTFHHPKLITDGLMLFKGDRKEFCRIFFKEYDVFSTEMKLNILNYFRFANIRCDEKMLCILDDEKENDEIRFSAIRYFEKFPNDGARSVVQSLAENLDGRIWEYQAIATSALKSYPDDTTFRILVKNLSNSNWHVRQNSAMSCEKLGYTYHDLISVFDGNDRYAREIMRYRLDRRNFENEAVKS